MACYVITFSFSSNFEFISLIWSSNCLLFISNDSSFCKSSSSLWRKNYSLSWDRFFFFSSISSSFIKISDYLFLAYSLKSMIYYSFLSLSSWIRFPSSKSSFSRLLISSSFVSSSLNFRLIYCYFSANLISLHFNYSSFNFNSASLD